MQVFSEIDSGVILDERKEQSFCDISNILPQS